MFFELHARYRVAALFLQKAAGQCGLAAPTVLELGADGTNYLGEFYPEAQLTPSNPFPNNLRRRPENFIEADAADLGMLADDSFDFVISLAVLEHVPREKHKAFLSESSRVAKIGVFHGAPFGAGYVRRAERAVSDYYESLYGVKHRWLEEHLLNGHPDIDHITGILQELGRSHSVFEHMDVDIWERFYKLQLAAQAGSAEAMEQCSRYYAEKLFFHDIGAQNVFKHIYISKSGRDAGALCRDIEQAFTPHTDNTALLDEIEGFKRQVLEPIYRERQDRAYRNARRLCVLDFADHLMKTQQAIYLYGVTPHLQFWAQCIGSARGYPIVVLDSYQTGEVEMTGARDRPALPIHKPQPADVKGKTVVVFPEGGYEEISRYLESVGARGLFHADIAE